MSLSKPENRRALAQSCSVVVTGARLKSLFLALALSNLADYTARLIQCMGNGFACARSAFVAYCRIIGLARKVVKRFNMTIADGAKSARQARKGFCSGNASSEARRAEGILAVCWQQRWLRLQRRDACKS